MKKSIYIFICTLIVCGFSFTGCASFSKKKTVEATQTEYDKIDEYIGYSYKNEKNSTLANEYVKIKLNGETGIFSIYGINVLGKETPLLTTVNSGSSSYFVIKAGNKVYKLDLKSGMAPSCRRTENSIQFVYSISRVAQIVVDFRFMSSKPESENEDMIEVNMYITNTGNAALDFSTKGIFDTFLGEGSQNHFSTKTKRAITAEKQISDMKDDRWIKSSDGSSSIQFLLNGKDITDPVCVTMANKDQITRSNWIPTSMDSRSFNSVLSYNNSVLCINWDSVVIQPLETENIKFYIVVASDGLEPQGNKFLADLDDIDSPVIEVNEVKADKENKPTVIEASEDVVEIITEDSDIVIDVEDITEEQLDTEYIQDLLNRIDNFVVQGDCDSTEYKRLNAELDAILEKLGMN